jgi:DNA-directed RNA polymerase II subunit RPB2
MSETIMDQSANSSRSETNNIKTEIDVDNYIEEPHTIIDSCFRGRHLNRLVEHQIESYNDFIGYQVPRTISMFNPVHICSEHDLDKNVNKYRLEMFITCENFKIFRAQIHEMNGATTNMFPQEARDRNFTYAGDMTIDLNIQFVVRNGQMLENTHTFNKILPNIHIGKMPIMLKSTICILEHYKHIPNNISGECRMDSGGYFIVNGSEKTVIGQERAAENLVQCFNISKNNKELQKFDISSADEWEKYINEYV